ncbi:hypothetical protein [Terriglobus roseus]|uniref:Protein RecA n=1 Tax=Terriglobus roseus TaxID=392734 RepID=A0A1G7NS02_9BACT|nr:hypothetical protein [Terriglobus roseus]SDF76717.1 recombination protein RecA [Terriglobus roseus]
MNASARVTQIRSQIETSLERRIPSALTPRPKLTREQASSGIADIDEFLEGGLPVGAIAEFIGNNGSGRTTAAIAFVAAAIRGARVAAWIDVSDTLDPAGASLNGVDLSHLLWVRCDAQLSRDYSAPMQRSKSPRLLQSTSETLLKKEKFHRQLQSVPDAARKVMQAHGGLQDHHAQREEQKARALAAPCCYEPKPHRRKLEQSRIAIPRVGMPSAVQLSQHIRREKHSYAAIERALRATDLLLQSGGFGIIVLDLGDVPVEAVWRIPMATWFRYRAACERSRTTLLVLTKHPCARSSAELVVQMDLENVAAEGGVMTQLLRKASVERQRFATQPNAVPMRKQLQRDLHRPWKGVMEWAV